MMWFGKSWGAPICDATEHVPAPVGLVCPECDMPIGMYDQGVTMPLGKLDGTVSTLAYHLDCWLRHVLPHGPDCERCRGLERSQHKMSCSYAKHGGNCDCPHGKDMQRLLDPSTTLAELRNIAGRMGISERECEDIGRRGVAFVESLKRRRTAHNPPDDAGNGKAP